MSKARRLKFHQVIFQQLVDDFPQFKLSKGSVGEGTDRELFIKAKSLGGASSKSANASAPRRSTGGSVERASAALVPRALAVEFSKAVGSQKRAQEEIPTGVPPGVSSLDGIDGVTFNPQSQDDVLLAQGRALGMFPHCFCFVSSFRCRLLNLKPEQRLLLSHEQ